jgi:DNA processing protein
MGLSEMPLNWTARAQDFPKRNRIVAGMAQATIVVEAARRSGALITTRLAGEYGRQVFAVPGFPLDARSDGTNTLIRQGATLIRDAQDVIDDLQKTLSDQLHLFHTSSRYRTFMEEETTSMPDTLESSDNIRDRVTSSLSKTPVSLDDLSEHTGYSIPQLRTICLELEFSGLIEAHKDGTFSRPV